MCERLKLNLNDSEEILWGSIFVSPHSALTINSNIYQSNILNCIAKYKKRVCKASSCLLIRIIVLNKFLHRSGSKAENIVGTNLKLWLYKNSANFYLR
ncbi:hypothetical protein S225a_11740 [Candidatus Brocadiaceae bacterium S225]|nr:hypothetical protein S225a_11740 [Candidatus Brocadiaceae bacterium S225]